ncbi:MAG: hypothetical protein P8014_14060 [Acidihalobacter sp.]|uniref:hypothetical protein n=1 Tax=Acidihalobacter sp. TaxID=1872108 RepID=UPI00307FA5AC
MVNIKRRASFKRMRLWYCSGLMAVMARKWLWKAERLKPALLANSSILTGLLKFSFSQSIARET